MPRKKMMADGIAEVKADQAVLSDGTIMKSSRNENLLDLYHKAVQDTLLGNVDKSNPLYAFVKKSFDNMTKKIENENGIRSLEKIKDLVEDTTEYLSKGKETDYDFIEYKIDRTFFPWQRNVLHTLQKRNTLLCGRRCWSPDTKILMYDGTTKTVKDIKVGDIVMGMDNNPHKVVETHNGTDDMFELVDAKKNIIMKCNSEHLITAQYVREMPDRSNQGFIEGNIYDIPVKDFIKLNKKVQERFVVFHQSIEYPEQKHFIDPWLFGLWLGDGSKHHMSIAVHSSENELINKLHSYENEDIYLHAQDKNGTLCISFSGKRRAGSHVYNPYTNELKRLNVLNNKHIPTEYIVDSRENRLKLLAGLIDSDGCYDKKKNSISFSNTNKRIIDAFISIANSLGFRTYVTSKIPKCNGKECKRCWEVTIKGNVSKIPCVTPRKQARDNVQKNYIHFTVNPIGKGEFCGFKVEGNGRILLDNYIITHNSGKSFSEAGLAVLHCTKGYDTINGFNKQRSVLVMGLTISKTKDVFWENLIKYADISGMSYKADNANLRITFENGAFIQLVGNNSKTDREKLRGQDYSLIIIDEAQSQQALKYLMVDILGPIIKGRDSTAILSGTGAITAKGYWKDITDGDLSGTWKHYSATMKDNPTVPEDALETVLKDNGWTKDDITFRREYLAENIIDTTRIVYPVFHKYDIVPQNEYIVKMAIGVDYGTNDSNALVALGLSSNGKIYELETKKFNKSDVTTIVSEYETLANSLMEKYKIDKRQVVAVADTSDQSISNELWRKKVNIYNAYKVDRIQQIFDTREALKRGDVLVKSPELIEEMQCYIWKYDEETHSVIYETDDEYYHSDCLAAMRYAYYYLMHEKDRLWKNPLGRGNNQ